MGALEYVPQLLQFTNDDMKDLDLLVKLGASSGGARPKVMTKIGKENWIVKFPSSMDSPAIGEEEYRYMNCAKKCGIETPEVKLFPSKLHQGYFGTKRFDRENSKIHMISVSGLLETSHRYPNLDYHDLMKLTYILTKDYSDVEEMFRGMCFNVYAHNRDDHSKNFSFLYLENESKWKLSPAYDLTYSNSIGGEHATCINGNGKDPDIKDILQVAQNAGISESTAKNEAEKIREIVNEELKELLECHL